MAREFSERVWAFVQTVPRGMVVTYGQAAEAAGSPRAVMAVGNAMQAALEEGRDVPWQRVVGAGGVISGGAPRNQRELLEEEGVTFDRNGRVNMNRRQFGGR